MIDIRTKIVACYKIDSMFCGSINDYSYNKKNISRRLFINYCAKAGCAGLILNSGQFHANKSEAAIPLLFAVIGVFSIASLAWLVSRPENGRIAFLNDSDKPQSGRAIFSAYDNMLSFRGKIPLSELEEYKKNSDRLFTGSGAYDVDPGTVAIYDVNGLVCPTKTNNLTVTAETRNDYSLIRGIKVS